ncbi:MAG: T9SS type A sorting domain-containing protein [Bacteroidota bacterium]
MSKIIFPAFIAFVFLLISHKYVAQPGMDCNNPHIITSIPFQQTGMTTQGFGDDYDQTSCCTSVYMTGNDYVFEYTPVDTVRIRIELQNTSILVGLFVIKGCPDDSESECIYSVEEANGNPLIYSVELIEDTTYYIVVSTYESFGYFLSTNFDIFIDYSYPFDAAIWKLYYPRSGCEIVEDVNLYIENRGTDTISNFDLGYRVDGGTPVVQTCTFVIPPGVEQNFTFWTPLDFSVVGQTYYLEVFTMLTGDGNNNNDTIKRFITRTPDVSSFPYFEDFESGQGGWAADWINSSGSPYSWQLGIPAAPIIDTAYSGTNAWVTNLTGNINPNERSFVISPCFDFSGMVLPIIDFWIWYDTHTWDYVVVEYSIDSSMTWHQLGDIGSGLNWYNTPTGQQYAGWHESSGGWINAVHTCDGLGGYSQVQLRIYFEGGVTDLNEGFAFDDFRIYESPLNDIGILNVQYPINKCGYTDTENISIAVNNHGMYDQFNFEVFYSIDGGNTFVNETVTDTMHFQDTLIYTFNTSTDISVSGLYNLICGISMINDENSINDTIDYSFYNYRSIDTYPYFEDFEMSDGGWYATGIESTWEHGIPTDTVINVAYSGNNIWVTNLAGLYNEGEQSFLYTPCFDLSNLSRPRIKFAIWYEVEIVGTQLEVSTDGGQDWDVYGSSADPQWYNQGYNWINHSGGWVIVQHNLYSLAGQPQVQFRYRFTGIVQFSGFAVDAFEICEEPIAGFDYIVNGLEINFTDTSSYAESYLWDFGDTYQSTDQSPLHEYSIGDTTVIITQIVYNDCYTDTMIASVYITGINEPGKNEFFISPNPFNKYLIVKTSENDNKFVLYSIDGEAILNRDFNRQLILDLYELTQGIYFIKIVGKEGVLVKKVIKN